MKNNYGARRASSLLHLFGIQLGEKNTSFILHLLSCLDGNTFCRGTCVASLWLCYGRWSLPFQSVIITHFERAIKSVINLKLQWYDSVSSLLICKKEKEIALGFYHNLHFSATLVIFCWEFIVPYSHTIELLSKIEGALMPAAHEIYKSFKCSSAFSFQDYSYLKL